jgi:putative protease
MPEKKLIGEITHFFGHINVAVVKLSAKLKDGDKILIEGATTNFEQEAKSMQIEHKEVKEAKKGDSIGLKVKDKVREGDSVYKLVDSKDDK